MGKKKLKHGTAGGHAGRKRRAVTLANCPWDTGPDTAAQRAGKVIEDATYTDPETGEKRNPNGVKRARRIDLAEHLRNKGFVSERGLRAALLIRDAFERTMRSPPAIKKVQVDTSPKPDHAVAIMVDRISAYHAAVQRIPPKYWSLVTWVVIDNQHPSSHPAVKRMDLPTSTRYRVGCRAFGKMIDEIAEAMGL